MHMIPADTMSQLPPVTTNTTSNFMYVVLVITCDVCLPLTLY